MANKYDTALDVIQAKLAELATATPPATAVVKAVVRRVIDPLAERSLPIIGLVASRLRRVGGPPAAREWEGSVILVLCTRGKDVKCDESLTDLIAEVAGKLDALPTDGSLKAVVDSPTFDFWYPPNMDYQLCGAVGGLRLKIQGPLKT
jgi:hypothetical protein